MHIRDDLHIPKYRQLYDILMHNIEKEGLKEGDRIPSEPTLIQTYGVSRNTVRQAIDLLVQEGVVYRIQGKGTFYKGKRRGSEKKPYLVGVITPLTKKYIYPSILQGIEDCAYERRYSLILGNSGGDTEKEWHLLQNMLQRGIEGLIIEPAMSAHLKSNTRLLSALERLSIPVVFMDCYYEDLPFSFVTPDDVEGGRLAASYLMNWGHRRVGIVYKKDVVPGVLRLQGFREVVRSRGGELREEWVWGFTEAEDQPGMDPARKLVAAFLSLPPERRPTALFFYNDLCAIQGLQEIRKAGLSVPGDVSILGFDDSEYAHYAEIPLTSLVHPKEELGRKAADLLFEAIDSGDRSPRVVKLVPGIVERESMGSPSR
ncbi:GntR family transcriptional regulator [Spirochaeta thermophila]|uniref:Transcriptional repressor n=1 Tax=Winmispira thermophila (strain ATCC 49972 / DSM 6192 / RI 19.B1) TaxID=665571 RepID=E0RPK2_WINT6|nr:GntR family transcriptional regulator [Spirochaeta thermophila]ADN02784.1 transcriptional repressor [Spirochaeta thermophila DSM 6192]